MRSPVRSRSRPPKIPIKTQYSEAPAALAAQRRQLPVQHVARRTGLVAELQLFNRTQFLDQFTNRLMSIRDHSNRSDLSVLLCNGDRNVSAWTSKPTNFILFTDRLLSLVALRFGLTDSQRNPRAAKRSRSFHGHNQDLDDIRIPQSFRNRTFSFHDPHGGLSALPGHGGLLSWVFEPLTSVVVRAGFHLLGARSL